MEENRVGEIAGLEKRLKAAEESLKRLSAAVEQTRDMVVITARDGSIEYANPSFERVTGYSRDEVFGKTPRILKSGRHGRVFYERLWDTILAGDIFKAELIDKKKSDEFYRVEKTVTPIRDNDGSVTHFVSIDRDITGHKEMEKTKRLARLGELAADMAHEVNNPLMIISGNAQLSLMSVSQFPDPEIKNYLETIVRECQRAKTIVQRLLKFSHPSCGRLKETDINITLDMVTGMLEYQFKLDNIELVRNYCWGEALALVDEQQMQEVFINLLNNARDAMPAGGRVEISTYRQNGMVVIEVKDNGCGMPEEVSARLFEPFFTTKEKGTGLGLSVCYDIVRAHKGKLQFKSRAGEGTTFIIFLPEAGRAADV